MHQKVFELQKEYLIELEDAVVVVKTPDGKIKAQSADCQRRLNFPHFCRSNIPQAAGSVISRWVDQALSAAADVPGAWARAVA